ncbi:hypothetical protein OPQ81_011031 [Rhizoctonia solani]|nr:hypothetical protein OPQ81_000672 [Rhizoctonia solani]KAJ1306335.1 hypothetical protein OPQ81_011031 [Rhizoctonia solani]
MCVLRHFWKKTRYAILPARMLALLNRHQLPRRFVSPARSPQLPSVFRNYPLRDSPPEAPAQAIPVNASTDFSPPKAYPQYESSLYLAFGSWTNRPRGSRYLIA